MNLLHPLLNAALLIALGAFLAACQTSQSSSGTASTDQITLIIVNDTYRADNFPYLRTLRTDLEKTDGQVLVLHAGDMLYPSLQSRIFDGKQMVNALNRLDGDADAQDPFLFFTFGNHEFDKDKLKDAAKLQARINESQFRWLGSNIQFKRDSAGQPLIKAEQVVQSALITVNGTKVGLVSATTDVKNAEYIERFLPPVDTVRQITRSLRAQGAQLVIGVTHQTVSEDIALLQALGNDAPDFIAGGHEHERKHEVVNGRHLVKADSDAASAAVVRLALRDGKPLTDVRYVTLPGDVAPSPALLHSIEAMNQAFDREYCAQYYSAQPNCLSEKIGKTNVELVGEELTIRRFETNLGNYLADTARATYAAEGAQIAFLNSGGMRLNYNLPAGDITLFPIDTLIAYPTPLALIRISGKQLQDVVNHAITDWTGNGHWLQISGFAFRHDPEHNTADQLSLITPSGLRPIQPDEVLLAVTSDFLLNLDNNNDQDGYTMLGPSMVVDDSRQRPELKKVLINTLKENRKAGITPAVQGRICNLQISKPCALFK
ncbi:MAG TPA: 5'-nucleotidase C-terminal domain-containing protein [Dongiaceae bacterium]|nr:5'-nucleotidase C-terminal domain-containing protein [Dongiaceae bacterium]